MCKNIYFLLALVLAMITVQQVQASTIEYTLKGNFISLGSNDPFGVGSRTASTIINFNVNTDEIPFNVYYYSGSGVNAQYHISNMSIKLIGTNVDGLYYSINNESILSLNNFFPSYPNDLLSYFSNNIIISNDIYTFVGNFALPISFWDNNDIPNPKIVNQIDTIKYSIFPMLNIREGNDVFSNYTYFCSDTSISSQVVGTVPVPSAILLLGSGLIGLAGWRRLRKG